MKTLFGEMGEETLLADLGVFTIQSHRERFFNGPTPDLAHALAGPSQVKRFVNVIGTEMRHTQNLIR